MPNLRKTPLGYDWSYICFFDILGFADKLGKLSEAAIRELIGFTRIFSQADGAILVSDLAKYRVRTYRTQDSYVRACELGWIKDAINPDALDSFTWNRLGYVAYAETVTLCHIIMNFMRKGLYVRGAVTIGEISFDEDYAMGTGFVKAYGLETSVAQYPRIIIDERALASILNHPFFSGMVSRVLSIDHDGSSFVDYLKLACADCVASPDAFAELLKEHQAWTRHFCKEKTIDPKRQQKQDWLADYHNDTVSLYPGLVHKTGAGYRDLAVKEPNTQASKLRLRRIAGKRPTKELVWNRSWDVFSQQS